MGAVGAASMLFSSSAVEYKLIAQMEVLSSEWTASELGHGADGQCDCTQPREPHRRALLLQKPYAVRITQGPEVESAQDNLVIIKVDKPQPGGGFARTYGVVTTVRTRGTQPDGEISNRLNQGPILLYRFACAG